MSSTNSYGFSETVLETAPPHVSKRRKHAPVWRRREVHLLLLAALLIALLAIFALASSEADEVDVTEMAQAWVDNPAQNYGLLLRQASAAGYVIYDFCSERGVSPCTATQTSLLTVWYR